MLNPKLLKPKTLYEGETITTAQLSESALNFEEIIIEWTAKQYTNFWKCDTTTIINPENKSYNKSNVYFDSSNRLYTINVIYTVNNDVITINNNHAGMTHPDTAYGANGGCWAITKVIGINKKITN